MLKVNVLARIVFFQLKTQNLELKTF